MDISRTHISFFLIIAYLMVQGVSHGNIIILRRKVGGKIAVPLEFPLGLQASCPVGRIPQLSRSPLQYPTNVNTIKSWINVVYECSPGKHI